MVTFTLENDVRLVCAILLHTASFLANACCSDLNNQQISQHRQWIPAVLVTIFHPVQSLHLLLVEFP